MIEMTMCRDLVAGLSRIGAALPPRGCDFCLQRRGDTWSAIALNANFSARTAISVLASDEADCYIPAGVLPLLRSLDSGDGLTLKPRDKQLEIVSASGIYQFPVQRPDFAPAIPDLPDGQKFQVPRADFLRAVQLGLSSVRVEMAFGSVFENLHFKGSDDGLTIEGFYEKGSLSLVRVDAECADLDVVVSAVDLESLNRFFADSNSDLLTVAVNDKLFVCSDGQTQVFYRVASGEFPNLQQNLTAQYQPVLEMVCDRTSLLAALERSCLSSADSPPRILLRLSRNGAIALSVLRSPDEVHNLIPAEVGQVATADNTRLFVNPHLLIDSIQPMRGDTISISLPSHAGPPIGIFSADDASSHYVAPAKPDSDVATAWGAAQDKYLATVTKEKP